MSAAAKEPFEVRGWHVLAAMVLFFGVIILVNVVFAVVAVRSFPGEDVRRSYLQGLQYNDTLAERRAQLALGWRAAALFAEDGAVVVTLTTRDGAPLDGLAVRGDLQRPTAAQFDRVLAFEALGGGRYGAHLDDLQPGTWRLRAHAERAGGGALDFEAELRWAIAR